MPRAGLIHFVRELGSEHARGVHDTYEFRFPDETWHIAVDDGVRTEAGPARAPAVLVTMDLVTFSQIGLGSRNAVDALASRAMVVIGDPVAVARSLAIAAVMDAPPTVET